jgi:uncharacterized protein DUF4231
MFNSMTSDEYLTKRVDQFQAWYDKKAVGAKRTFLRIRTLSVVGAVLVPVIANVRIQGWESYSVGLTTVVSLFVSVAVALDSVYHFGDQWKNYRSTEQFLSREKFLFQTGEGPYKGMEEAEALVLLVERCEGQIAAENSATLNVIATAAQQAGAVGAHTP